MINVTVFNEFIDEKAEKMLRQFILTAYISH